MPRGFRWGLYTDDTGNQWRVKVDADYLLDPPRGWSLADPGTTIQLPRGWRPRYVIGVDEGGLTQRADVASVDAPAWTGEAPTFAFYASDQELHTATIFARRGELRIP